MERTAARSPRWPALVVVLGVVATMCTTAPAAAADPCVDVFDAGFRQSIATEFPGRRVTAAVFDTRTGCWHHLSQGMRIETASVVKAQFLAGTLLRAQDGRRGLTSFEQSRIAPMISFSFNPQASDLFVSLGGVNGMDGIDRRFGLTSTTHTTRWGSTVSTAQDRTKLALALLYGGGPLNDASRSLAWFFMSFVHGSQQWGISAGVPDGWSVALKNGFFPTAGEAAWRIGSTGFVRDDLTGEGYAVTIMSDRNSDHVGGQRLVERVSERIATVLTTGDSTPRLVDRSRCVIARSGESWGQVAARIGTNDAAGTQTASGGISNPVGGMRACAPDFTAPPGPNPKSTIGGVHLPLTGDFDGDGRSDVFWYRPGPGADALWSGNADGTFAATPVSVSGTYQPLTGDFNGDTTTDIFWYRPGPGTDYLWSGNPDGTGFTSTTRSVTGTYHPLTGDFNGDTTTDIFWYRPGPGTDHLWPGTVGGGFGNAPINVSGDYEATVADLNGDGRADIVWNAPGTASDSSWTATSDLTPAFTSRSESIPGVPRPVVGDLDGDAEIEVLFYGPGAEHDLLFDGAGRANLPVHGRYEPLTGDFDGDGRGDVLFYGRGDATDSMWLGTTDAAAPRSVQPRAF